MTSPMIPQSSGPRNNQPNATDTAAEKAPSSDLVTKIEGEIDDVGIRPDERELQHGQHDASASFAAPGSTAAPPTSRRNDSSQIRIAAPVAMLNSHTRLIVSFRILIARGRSARADEAAESGHDREDDRGDRDHDRLGDEPSQRVRRHQRGRSAIPNTTTSLASMTVITRFHRRNHQLSPMKPRISSKRGRAIPNHPTRDLAM